MTRFTYIAVLFCLITNAFGMSAATDVRFGNEASDTTTITNLLVEASQKRFENPEARVAFFASKFTGTPYAAHTLEGDEEVLTIRVDSLDCTTFAETVLALAMTSGEGRSSWRDYVYNLRRLRYRGGEVNGYPSRLHYICDWAVDNRHRGNIKDVTPDFPGCSYVLRTIDFMSSHRNSYPALADSANYARIRQVESGYKNHRFPYIKTAALASKAVQADFHNGDVVAFVSNLRDLDVTHMGVVVKDAPDAVPYVIHASSKNGKVERTTMPLADFVKRNRSWIGVRVFRLNE